MSFHAGLAVLAHPASAINFTYYTLANKLLLIPLYLLNNTNKLVANDASKPHVTLYYLEIGITYASETDLYEGLTISRLGNRIVA